MSTKTIASAALAALLFASPAWAVVIDIVVKDSTGKPIPGAVMSAGSARAKTSNEGTTQIDVPAAVGERQELIIVYGGRELTRVSIEVRQGVQIPVTAPVALPIRTGGRNLGGLTPDFVNASILNESLNTKLGAQDFTQVNRISGGTTTLATTGTTQTIPASTQTFRSTLTPEQLASVQAVESKVQRLTSSMGFAAGIPLAGFGGGSMPSLRSLVGAGAPRATRSLDDAASGGSGGWRFHPSVNVGVNKADVTFETNNVQIPSASPTFDGDGLMWSAGVNGVIFPCSDCQWFGTVGYRYTRTGDLDMTRTPVLAAPVAGTAVVEDRATYQYWSHAVRGTIGYAFRYVAPWGGVRSTHWRARLEIDSVVDLTRRFGGVSADQTVSFRNRYAERLLEAIGGVDVRLGDTGLVVRAEGAWDGENHAFSMGFGYGFGR